MEHPGYPAMLGDIPFGKPFLMLNYGTCVYIRVRIDKVSSGCLRAFSCEQEGETHSACGPGLDRFAFVLEMGGNGRVFQMWNGKPCKML